MNTKSQPLVIEKIIAVNAPASKVWDVLILPKYIKEWDDVPEDFNDEKLRLGSVLEWPGSAKLTVTEIKPYQQLKLTLRVAKWQDPVPNNIAYLYTLAETNKKTTLTITIGDFASLADGKDYYDASIDFAQTAAVKIKTLSEH